MVSALTPAFRATCPISSVVFLFVDISGYGRVKLNLEPRSKVNWISDWLDLGVCSKVYVPHMKVQILYFVGCPNHVPAVELVRSVASKVGNDISIEEVEVKQRDDVASLKFLGSPTILIDGLDVEPAARHRTDYGFSCRVYGSSGLPDKSLIRAALGNDGLPKLPRRNTRSSVFSMVGAVAVAVAASACCWLPVLLIGLGVSAAGVSTTFEPMRPYLLGVSGVLLAFAFRSVYFKKANCAPDSACPTRRVKADRFSQAMVWFATILVIGFAAFPNMLGMGSNRGFDTADEETQLAIMSFQIEGMTCAGCASLLEQKLSEIDGVEKVNIDYEQSIAEIAFHTNFPPNGFLLTETIQLNGFEVMSLDSTNKHPYDVNR